MKKNTPSEITSGEKKPDKDKEALLALLLEEAEGNAGSPIAIADRSMPIPLSFAQERIWFIEQLEIENSLHHFHGMLRFSGSLKTKALKDAINTIVGRHEILRTIIQTNDGIPVQVINPAEGSDVTFIDLSDSSKHEREKKARNLYKKEANRPFDLGKGPLMRSILIRLSQQEHFFILVFHHIICEGWALQVFFKEFCLLYSAFAEGKPSPLKSFDIQYADFAVSQRQWLQGDVLKDKLNYWKERLAGELNPLPLPTDRPRPPVQDFSGNCLHFEIPPPMVEALRALSIKSGVTLFMTLLSVFKVLLYRYSGQDDIVVGTASSERKWVETEDLIGLFINNLVLRTDLSGNPSFRELLLKVKDTALTAFEHQDLPFELLVKEINPDRDRSRGPLFQVLFTYYNAPKGKVDLPDLHFQFHQDTKKTSAFDLSLYIDPEDSEEGKKNGLKCWFEYSTSLFDEATIRRMIGHYIRIVNVVLESPDSSIATIPLLTEEEHHQQIIEWNSTRTVYSGTSLQALFEKQVNESPDAIAVMFEDCQLTYRELNYRANQLAHYLRDMGVGPEALVGICVERSLQMVVGLLGILKAGGAYVPLDPDYPKERLAFMIKDAQIFALLTEEKQLKNLPSFDKPVICLDTGWNDIAKKDHENIDSGVTPDNLAYVIYTSGSTGKPKGVQIEHRNVVNFLSAMRKRPGLSGNDILLAVTTISFDIHVLELFLPLITGAKVMVVSRETAVDGKRLYDLLVKNKITVMQGTPSTWQLLLDSGWNDRLSLKILCGGEALHGDLVAELLPRCSSLWNMYGPTETAVWSSVEPITSTDGTITVGHPIDNTQFYIVDGHSQPVPVGVSGELLIGGSGLSRGYLNRSELNTERFVVNPFSKKIDTRLYRTGDWARYLPDGRVIVSSRMDNQVKIRGFRVELGEIEMALVQHETVHRSVVIVREDDPGDQRLTAYLIPVGLQRSDPMTLRTFLQNRLPNYMLPSAYVWLDSYPMTPNKKVDQRALPAPEKTRSINDKDFDETKTKAEQIFAGIFQDILQIDRAGRLDNFFDLGGHSLLAMKVVDRFEKATGVRMEVGELFQQTVGQIAAWNEKKIEDKTSRQTGKIMGKLNIVLNKFFPLSNHGNTQITKQNQ